MYENYLDGVYGVEYAYDGEENTEARIEAADSAIAIDTSGFLKDIMIQKFIMTSQTGFLSLKKYLVQRFAQIECYEV